MPWRHAWHAATLSLGLSAGRVARLGRDPAASSPVSPNVVSTDERLHMAHITYPMIMSSCTQVRQGSDLNNFEVSTPETTAAPIVSVLVCLCVGTGLVSGHREPTNARAPPELRIGGIAPATSCADHQQNRITRGRRKQQVLENMVHVFGGWAASHVRKEWFSKVSASTSSLACITASCSARCHTIN